MQSIHLLQTHYWDSERSVRSAKLLIGRKLYNMMHIIMRARAYRRSAYPLQDRILQRTFLAIINLTTDLRRANNRTHIMLIEARASRAYWQSVACIGKCPLAWKRTYPHARDFWNIELNIGYTLLLHLIKTRVFVHGCTSEIGILHAPQKGHEALVYDVEELFRAPVVESVLLPLWSRKANTTPLSTETVIAAISKQFDRQVRYRGAWWKLRAVIDGEIGRYANALRKGKIYVPYRHSWAHWTKRE